MVTHLLDTSVYSQRIRKAPDSAVITRWQELGDALLAISSVCEAELLFGLTKRGSDRLWLEYEEFLKDHLTQIPFGSAEASVYAEAKDSLVAAGTHIGELDLMIGATALAHGLVLATLNIRHFQLIDELEVEDWGSNLPSDQ